MALRKTGMAMVQIARGLGVVPGDVIDTGGPVGGVQPPGRYPA